MYNITYELIEFYYNLTESFKKQTETCDSGEIFIYKMAESGKEKKERRQMERKDIAEIEIGRKQLPSLFNFIYKLIC